MDDPFFGIILNSVLPQLLLEKMAQNFRAKKWIGLKNVDPKQSKHKLTTRPQQPTVIDFEAFQKQMVQTDQRDRIVHLKAEQKCVHKI